MLSSPVRLVLLCWLLAAAGCRQAAPVGMGEPDEASVAVQAVRGQVAAFNRQDLAALVAGVSPDIVWYDVSGDSLRVVVMGRAAFEEAMGSYLAQLPSVRSAIDGIAVSGGLVSFREEVTWEVGNGETRTQSTIGVYDVRDGLIRRAWYFPAQQDDR